MNSSNTITRSCSTTNFKRFHIKDLGIPPTYNNHLHVNSIEKPTKFTQQSIKIAPMKEVEKMIKDLKKENFDLKLRLYHLEDMMNNKEIELHALKEKKNLKPKVCSKGTQTTTLFESTPEAFGLSSFKKSSQNLQNYENISSVVIALENIKIDRIG